MKTNHVSRKHGETGQLDEKLEAQTVKPRKKRTRERQKRERRGTGVAQITGCGDPEIKMEHRTSQAKGNDKFEYSPLGLNDPNQAT